MAPMGFATRISVPTNDVPRVMNALSRAGYIVLDRGERISTEDGVDTEATLDLVDVTT